MSGQRRQSSPEGPASAPSGVWADKPFLGVAALLLVVAVGWNVAMPHVGVVMAKEPVPPPPLAQVVEHQLVNFPADFGPYELAGDGELFMDEVTKRPIMDGKPDGLLEDSEDNLVELGTLNHRLNWYCFSIYRDTREPPGSPRSFVRMDITYYTGLLDAVPHVPEACIVAGGGALDSSNSGSLRVRMPQGAAPPEWEEFDLHRTAYRSASGQSGAQYHVMCMNGLPVDWKEIRLKMAWMKYCYFAKIQLAPVRLGKYAPGLSQDESDEVCREFVKTALPEVLRYLPSAADVEKLKAGK